MKSGIFVLALALTTPAMGDIIYGQDNRRDVYEEADPNLLEISRSVAVQIHKNELGLLSNLKDQSYRKAPQKYKMCEDERFINQKSIGICSASLIAPNLLLTAWHCVPRIKKDCANYRWAFDYKMISSTEIDKSYKDRNNVYACKSIASYNRLVDFAIIELDRPVKDRTPLKISYEKMPVSNQNEIMVMGYPSGLPLKIADGGFIKAHTRNGYAANLDTYGGNSGSPVFNKSTREIIGILTEGQSDFVFNFKKECWRSHVVINENLRRYTEAADKFYEYIVSTESIKRTKK